VYVVWNHKRLTNVLQQ